MSSSIPSWQIWTVHAQPFRGARDLVFCLKVPLDSLLVWASSEGSDETARMHRLAWTIAAHIGDKYQIRLTRSIYSCFLFAILEYKIDMTLYWSDFVKWEKEIPLSETCSITIKSLADCGGLSAPDNGFVDLSGGTTFKKLALYSCDEGYYVYGSRLRECQADHSWSGLPPVCQLHGKGSFASNFIARLWILSFHGVLLSILSFPILIRRLSLLIVEFLNNLRLWTGILWKLHDLSIYI